MSTFFTQVPPPCTDSTTPNVDKTFRASLSGALLTLNISDKVASEGSFSPGGKVWFFINLLICSKIKAEVLFTFNFQQPFNTISFTVVIQAHKIKPNGNASIANKHISCNTSLYVVLYIGPLKLSTSSQHFITFLKKGC